MELQLSLIQNSGNRCELADGTVKHFPQYGIDSFSFGYSSLLNFIYIFNHRQAFSQKYVLYLFEICQE